MMVWGLYEIPSCKVIETFNSNCTAFHHKPINVRDMILEYVQYILDHPTAHYGTGNEENAIYIDDQVRYFVAQGEDWYFDILQLEDKYPIPNECFEPHGHGVND